MGVKDFKISSGESAKGLFNQFGDAGFQASELFNASKLLKQMASDKKCTRFLAFTANLMASGLRGILVDMIKRKMFDAVITTGGSVDHDFIRSFSTYEKGSFSADDELLHKKKVNRLGNILVPNDRYVSLEKKIQPVFKELYSKQKVFSARELCAELGKRISDKNSFLRACHDNKVPIFSPGFVDSAVGLQLYFFKQDHRDFILDSTRDMPELATMVLSAKRTGALVLGGGISKHYAIASNLLRGGLDYAVYITTATPFDGSLSGASVNEARSWGKVKVKAKAATVYAEASLALPLLYSSML